MANKNLTGTSADAVVAAVAGENTGIGPAVHGKSTSGRGVVAESDTNYALRCASRTMPGIRSSSIDGRGIEGESVNSDAILGNAAEAGAGVTGISKSGHGVHGKSISGRGVVAESDTDYALRCASRTNSGIRSSSTDGRGIEGESAHSDGVLGSAAGAGSGVFGISVNGIGIHGKGGRLAGFFEGDVEVTGDIRLMNADFAEDFDIEGETEPGEVMVLTVTGALKQSAKAYDKKVVGVISGAGNYKPGIILDKQNNNGNRKPIAMMGKVYCKVDADTAPIETGDMLTSSDIPGYAMKAMDPFRAFGAVIGKALGSLTKGKGLIPILVVLQ